MPTRAEDRETVNGHGSDAGRRLFEGQALHQVAGIEPEQRLKRQNLGNNVPLQHNLVFRSRDQVGSGFPGENMSYPPARTMLPGFHSLTDEGNISLIDRNIPAAEAGSSSSFGLHQSYNGSLLRTPVSGTETWSYSGNDSLGNYTGSPYSHLRFGDRGAFKRKSSMDDVHAIGSVGSVSFRPLLEQRGRDFTEESSTGRADFAIPPLSSDLVSMGRIPVLDEIAYSRDSILPSRARLSQHLHVGSNRYHGGGHAYGSQEVYQSGRGLADVPLSHPSTLRGAPSANEYMMPPTRRTHDLSPINQGNLSSAALVHWSSDGFVSGESSENHSHAHLNFNTGTGVGSQASNFLNPFELSSRGFHGYPPRESTSHRSYPASVPPMYSDHHILSSHPPAVPLISHNRYNAPGGPVPYRHAVAGTMNLESQTAPESAYSSFGLANRWPLMRPFGGPRENVEASPIRNYYRMPFQGLDMLPAHRGRGQRFPAQEPLIHALAYNAFDIQDRQIGLQPDVDNMSYEELLALEEIIGNVNTGLSEENIRKCLKTSKRPSYGPVTASVSISQESEIKCSICQEEYMEGEEVGQLKCSHSYHTSCIKQWLVLKNQCPICKAAALS